MCAFITSCPGKASEALYTKKEEVLFKKSVYFLTSRPYQLFTLTV